jgi:hypothetical protein
MALVEVFAPHLGRTVKLGGRKKNPEHHARSLKLESYLDKRTLPDPPSSADYSAKAASVLSDIMANDSLGDCVFAASYHALGVWTGNAGDLFHATVAQVVSDYSAVGGYVPGNPATDQGADIGTALDYYGSKGFADGSKLLGHLAVNAEDATELRQAVFLFESMWLGLDLPAAYISPFPSSNGFVWDVAGPPVPENGHCIEVVGYTTSGLLVATWGLIGTITWAAVAKYCVVQNGGDLYVGVSPDQVTKGQSIAPNGVAWDDLIADFDAMGGSVAVPAAAPPEGGVMTLALAQEAAAQGIDMGNALMTKTTAIKLAARGLAAAWPAPSATTIEGDGRPPAPSAPSPLSAAPAAPGKKSWGL